MTKKREPMVTGEHMARLMADPDWVAKKLQRDREFEERRAKLRAAEEPILIELREAGYDISTISEFLKAPNNYQSAIPILVKHLLIESYPDTIREFIARALATPQSQYLWPLFVEEYKKTPDDREHRGYKDGLAVALSVTANDLVIEGLIDLVKDKQHGNSRLLLLRGIRKSKAASAKRAIEELASDQDFAKEIASWHRKAK